MKVWLRRLGWTVAALALLMLLAWLALPPLIKWQGQKQLTQLLGRQVTIGKVELRPWSLELTLHDAAIAGAAAGPPLFAMQRLHLNLQSASVWHRAPVIEALEIDAPALRLTRTAAGHYDIDDLIAKFTPKPGTPAAGEPTRFALANVQLRGGSVRFDDRPAGRVHELKQLEIGVPFLSDLPADVAIKVKPRLAFELNGAAFDSGGEATPFTPDRASSLRLRIGEQGKDELDLAPYLGYLPTTLPVRVKRGRVGAEIELQFAVRPDGTPSLTFKGDTHVSDLALTDAADAPLVAWKRLAVNLRDVQPLARRVALGAVQLDGAVVEATRDAAGRTNFEALATAPAASAPAAAAKPAASSASMAPRAASSASAAASGAATGSAPASTDWQLSIESLALTNGSVHWNDAATRPAAALAIDALTFSAKALKWPAPAPLPLQLSARIGVPGTPAEQFATLSIDGQANDREARLAWKLGGLPLANLAPYLVGYLEARVDGRFAADGKLDWAAAPAPRMKLAIDHAGIDALHLVSTAGAASAPRPRAAASAASAASPAVRSRGRGEGGDRRGAGLREDALSLQQLSLGGAEIDLLARRARIATVALQAPTLRVARDAEGRWNVLQWMATTPPASAASGAASSSAASAASASSPHSRVAAASAAGPASAPAWKLQLGELKLTDGRLRFVDAQPRPGVAPRRPVFLDIAGLKLSAQGFEWGAPTSPPMKLQLAATIGRIVAPDETNGPSSLVDWQGELALQPLAAKGTLRLQRVPVHVFTPYVDNPLRAELRRAYLGYRGTTSFRQAPGGIEADAGGGLRLDDVSVTTLAGAPASPASAASAAARSPDAITADELLRWQRLQLDDARFSLRPGAAPRIEIGQAELADFYSRLVVTEQGRFNLQDVTARDAPPATTAASAPQAAAAPASSASSAAAVDIRVAGTKLVNGRIDFADHFVKPNYSAALTELNGSLGAFQSGSREMAALELKGRAEGSALLEISGRLNPTADPLALDIRAKATDLELAPLSPYAGKYAGYAIQRGKLSMDVAYKIEPDGRLDAKNQLILNQLTFGDRIESPQATKLPVRLAVALLKDKNGVIDLNLPVSGSLNDPQFSVMSLIGKVLVNILVKAVTSPFALLAGGGGSEGGGLSQIEFKPGTALFVDGQEAALDKVAEALTDRPALNMTVTGTSDPARETDAYRKANVEQKLLAERRRELIRGGGAANAEVTLDAANRERLLKQLYDRSDLPGKPRNFIGLTKGLPVSEMAQRLEAAEPATPEAMRELALQRGLAVRDALIARGLKSDRLFLAAPRVGAAVATAERTQAVEAAASAASAAGVAVASEEKPWTPRAELSLAAN